MGSSVQVHSQLDTSLVGWEGNQRSHLRLAKTHQGAFSFAVATVNRTLALVKVLCVSLVAECNPYSAAAQQTLTKVVVEPTQLLAAMRTAAHEKVTALRGFSMEIGEAWQPCLKPNSLRVYPSTAMQWRRCSLLSPPSFLEPRALASRTHRRRPLPRLPLPRTCSRREPLSSELGWNPTCPSSELRLMPPALSKLAKVQRCRPQWLPLPPVGCKDVFHTSFQMCLYARLDHYQCESGLVGLPRKASERLSVALQHKTG